MAFILVKFAKLVAAGHMNTSNKHQLKTKYILPFLLPTNKISIYLMAFKDKHQNQQQFTNQGRMQFSDKVHQLKNK